MSAVLLSVVQQPDQLETQSLQSEALTKPYYLMQELSRAPFDSLLPPVSF